MKILEQLVHAVRTCRKDLAAYGGGVSLAALRPRSLAPIGDRQLRATNHRKHTSSQ